MNGHVEYRACRIIDEKDVSCMLNTFPNMVSVICMELRVEVHTSPSPCQANELICAHHCARQESCRDIVRITVPIKNLAEILCATLCMSGIL